MERGYALAARAASSVAVPAALAVLLGAVSWQVADTGPLLGVDRRVRTTVAYLRHHLHSPALDQVAQWLSDLGNAVPAVPALLGAGALAAWRARRVGRRRWWLPVPVAALAALAIPLLVIPAKAYFARPGPFGIPLAPDQLGWYPSGHTSTACIAYGVGALLVGRTLARRARRQLHAVTALAGLGVGAGLIWCDYHWFLDVLAGWSLAGLLLWGLSRWLPHPDR
ncbi:phosphatase PAP2 family protein [Kitasatospora nipponensis]|uniref:phosphatase PAP2 family protein n=1 Tax=Kitasatospora nipponensis TaxID=258049 RepID=UPI0031D8BE33